MPYVYCTTSSGRRAANPHPSRWPERGRRVYGKAKARQTEVRIQRLEKAAAQARRSLPLSLALRNIDQTAMTAYRERTG